MEEAAAVTTAITYAEGGYDPTKPHNNAILILSQLVDADGNPAGEPTVVYDATAE